MGGCLFTCGFLCGSVSKVGTAVVLLIIPNVHWWLDRQVLKRTTAVPMSVLNRGSNRLNIDDKIHIHHSQGSMEIDDFKCINVIAQTVPERCENPPV